MRGLRFRLCYPPRKGFSMLIVSFSWWHLVTGRARYRGSGYYELPPNTFADSSCDFRMQGLCSMVSQDVSVVGSGFSHAENPAH